MYEKRQMLELKMIDFYFQFIFYFFISLLFYFLFWDLKLGLSITSHVNRLSHDYVP